MIMRSHCWASPRWNRWGSKWTHRTNGSSAFPQSGSNRFGQDVEARTMDPAKRKALQAAGWNVGDAADFLEMSEEERQLLDARVEFALAIGRQREAHNLSQRQ